MNKKEPLEKEKSQEAAENSSPEEGAKAPRKKLVILLFAMLALSVGSAFVLTAIVIPDSAESQPSEDAAPETTDEDLQEGYYESKEFISNLHGVDWRRFIKVQVGIYFKALEPDKLKTELDERYPLFQDAMNSLLSGKTMDEIDSSEGKSKLKSEIEKDLSEIFFKDKAGNIEKVVFVTYLIQQG